MRSAGVLVLLLATACSSGAGPATTVLRAPATSTTTTVAPPPTDPVGSLAIVGADGNVRIVAADGSSDIPVTTDAGGAAGYFQPIWSRDGSRIAFSGVFPDLSNLTVASRDGEVLGTVVTPVFSFYHHWDPAGESIAFLGNGPGGIELLLADLEASTADSIDAGQPFYFDWSPGGAHLITQVGGDRLGIVTPGNPPDLLDAVPGTMQAPQWTADGDRWYVTTDARTELVRVADTAVTIALVDGFTTFAVDPDGVRVAIQSLSAAPPAASTLQSVVPTNAFVVVDTRDGSVAVVRSGPVIGFWWSPDGSRLAFLTLDGPDGLRLRWSLWEDGATTELTEFFPSAEFARDLLPFFDQYSRSMTVWSPDGRHLGFPGVVDDRPGIWIQPVDGAAPKRLSDGVWAVWSPVP